MLLVGLFVAFDQGLDHQIDGHFVNVFNVLRVAVAQRRLDGIQERIADFLICAQNTNFKSDGHGTNGENNIFPTQKNSFWNPAIL